MIHASSPSAHVPPTPREVDRDSRTAAAGTGLRRQPPFTCAGCGAELPPPKKNGHRRKWCSERCRKAQYAGACVDCGAPTNGHNGRSPKASKRCATCSAAHTARLAADRAASRRALVERLWAEGKTSREIGDLLGWKGTYHQHGIPRLRQLGYNLPHRYSPERVANQTAANRAMVARREAQRTAA